MSEYGPDVRNQQPERPTGDEAWPGYPPASAGSPSGYDAPPSYGTPASYGSPQQYGGQAFGGNPYQTSPVPTNPYATSSTPTNPYETSSVPTNPYETSSVPTNPYETNPYAVSPYGTSYGGASPYGYGTPLQPHPQSTVAMVLGIVGVAVFPLVGIAGLFLGLHARREIDLQPGRYGGRGMATAGFVLGIISVFACIAWLALFVILVASSSS